MKLYLSLAVIGALLPVVLWGVVSGQPTRLTTRADQANELRVWFVPAEVKARPGETIKLKVMANYDGGNNILPKIKVIINTPPNLTTTTNEINFNTPFTGQVSLGELSVRATTEGKYKVYIPDEGIYTGMNNLNATTFPAMITVVY